LVVIQLYAGECTPSVDRFLRFSEKRQDGSAPNLFQGLRENTCFLQFALKNTAPVFKINQSELEILLFLY